MGILTIQDDRFLIDGQPTTILSGAIHYFGLFRNIGKIV